MTDRATSLLLGTAVATALVHTLIPDHWLPFVLIGRARGWRAGTVAAVSGLSASIHALLSVLLGVLTLAAGREAGRFAGERLETASGVLLVVFGIGYAIWAWRKGGHFHPGGERLHEDRGEKACDGLEGDASVDHLHYHADASLIRGGADRSAFYLAAIVGLNPCVLILPIMVAGASRGTAAAALVTAAYCVTTVALMVGLSVVGVEGARRIPVPGAARHMELASGVLIALSGIAFLALEL